jgi:hypothetical protein
MFCRTCGSTHQATARFCNSCGTRLVAFTSPSDTPNNGLWARFNRPVGRFVLVLTLVLLALFIISYPVKPGNGGSPAPSNAGQTVAPQQEQVRSQAVVPAEPSAHTGQETPNQKKEKALQQQAWFLPDRPAPVALSKIKGIWWTTQDIAKSGMAEHKEFAFVEDWTVAAGRLTAQLSMSNGTNMVVRCLEKFRPMAETEPAPGSIDLECHYLPIHTWIRIMATDVLNNPESNYWGDLLY